MKWFIEQILTTSMIWLTLSPNVTSTASVSFKTGLTFELYPLNKCFKRDSSDLLASKPNNKLCQVFANYLIQVLSLFHIRMASRCRLGDIESGQVRKSLFVSRTTFASTVSHLNEICVKLHK